MVYLSTKRVIYTFVYMGVLIATNLRNIQRIRENEVESTHNAKIKASGVALESNLLGYGG